MMSEQTCPHCSHSIRCFVVNMTIELRCLNCGWSVASSILKHIDADRADYKLIVNSKNIRDDRETASVMKIFELSKTQIYQKKKNNLEIQSDFKAYQLKLSVDALDDLGIPYEIFPDFRFKNGEFDCIDLPT
jgi:hypothetical protein